jgi:aspartyl-tRNA synthetase
MCEFISLDLEMVINEHYMELLDLMGELCMYIFRGIEERYPQELKAINEQFPFEPFKLSDKVVMVTFEGIKVN